MVECDRVTIARAAGGDKKAFRKLYDHYAPFVWRIVYRSSGSDHEAAREIVQETFVRIHRSLKSFNVASSLGTWIYRIAFNTANGYWSKRTRYRQTTVPLADDRPDMSSRADTYEARELVEKILGELAEEDRFLLVAKEVDGMTFEEIAAITGKSPESLRTRMSRMKDRIRSVVEKKHLLSVAIV
jgi:RNA polymerase sigma-70 factor (ECF subfamily)